MIKYQITKFFIFDFIFFFEILFYEKLNGVY